MVCAAFWARPIPHRQRHFVHPMAADIAQLARWGESVNHSVGYAIPLAFVRELAVELSESGIGYAVRKVMVLHHPLYVQILHTDATHLVLVSQSVCEFVQEVASAVSDFGM